MKHDKFDIRLSHGFSGTTRFYAAVIAILGILLVYNEVVIIGILLMLPVPLVFISYRGIELDMYRKTYRIYTWVVGVKFGYFLEFEGVDYLYINAVNMSQTMHYKSLSSNIRFIEYVGFIRFKGDIKIRLLASNKKEHVIFIMKKVASVLQARILDRTESEVVELT